MANCQSQPSAFGLTGEQRIKDLPNRLIADTFPCVDEIDFHQVFDILGRDCQLPSIGHRFLGIVGQVQEDA